ncbi:MAG: cupredoxin domain-containing protein [Chloroflexota bacterium]
MRVSLPRSRRIVALLAAFVVVATGCGAAATPTPSWPAGSLVVTAKDRKFDTRELRFSNDDETQLVFVNADSEAHNIVIRTQPRFAGDVVFKFPPISKGYTVVTVGPLEPGSYFFLCDVHPQMKGTVVVT